jgi:hypothetical protein
MSEHTPGCPKCLVEKWLTAGGWKCPLCEIPVKDLPKREKRTA